MKILVTGGAGYIGSACVAALCEAGHEITVFDDLSTGQADKVSPQATLVEGDITDATAVQAVCASQKFDAVMHFAAKKAVGESESNPALYYTTNVTGTINLLQAMEVNHIPKLIFSSTAAVYEPPVTDTLFTEATPTSPVSVYGETKLIVEEIIKSFARTGKIESYTILRYFNVAGDAGLDYREEAAQNVFPIIARSVKVGAPFNIYGTDYDTRDGTCIRDYIHLRDLVTAHTKALLAGGSGTYNLGTGTGCSVWELVAAFDAALPEPLTVVESARRPGDVAVVVADASLAAEDLNWIPKHTLSEMGRDTLRVYFS